MILIMKSPKECNCQPEIKVSELCEETACLYKNPAGRKELCVQFGIGDKINISRLTYPERLDSYSSYGMS